MNKTLCPFCGTETELKDDVLINHNFSSWLYPCNASGMTIDDARKLAEYQDEIWKRFVSNQNPQK